MLSRYIRTLPLAVLAIGLVFAFGAGSAFANTPTTLQVTELDNMSVDLHGLVAAEGHKTNYAFGWGTTPNIEEWKNVSPVKTTESAETIEVGVKITGLTPSTKYYYAIGALDLGSLHSEFGNVLSFFTRSHAGTHEPWFMGVKEPLTIKGSLGNQQVLQIINAEYGPLPAVTCKSRNLSGVLVPNLPYLAVTPELSSCSSKEWETATIKANGCSYVFQVNKPTGANYSGPFEISCPAGAAIEVSPPGIFGPCTVRLASQALPSTSSVVFENTGPSTARYLSLPSGSASGLKFTAAGSGCKWWGIEASGEAVIPDFAGTTLKGTSGGAYDELFVSGG